MTKSYQLQYAEILHKLINEPRKKRPSRIGNIRSNFVELMRVDLTKEFPLMDLKKIKFSNILHELLWFIHGDTHIKYLVENGCNIWTDDAYRYYCEQQAKGKKQYIEFYGNFPDVTGKTPDEKFKPISKENFVELALKGKNHWGELDRVYGKQWREFNGKTDQLQNCINTLKKNPDDRRMIVTAHNPTDIEDEIVGLPSCHNMFQFYTIPLNDDERENLYYEKYGYDAVNMEGLDIPDDIPKFYLCTWFNIRSNDFFLGQPYNMASYALLTHIVANVVNMIPLEVVCTAIDCHLYEAHIEAAEEYLQRFEKIMDDNYIGETGNETSASDVSYCSSKIIIKRNLKSIDDVTADDIELIDYNPQSFIKAPLLT
jgi:thymidylate synthase